MRFTVCFTVQQCQEGKTFYYTDNGRFSKDRQNAKLFTDRHAASAVCKQYPGGTMHPVMVYK